MDKSFKIDTRDVHCPSCNAQPGASCTQPDSTGRHPVRSYHLVRVDHAEFLSEDSGPFEDKQGDIWEKGDDGLMHSYETAPFILEHVEKKWGPLTTVTPGNWRKLRQTQEKK